MMALNVKKHAGMAVIRTLLFGNVEMRTCDRDVPTREHMRWGEITVKKLLKSGGFNVQCFETCSLSEKSAVVREKRLKRWYL
jgi:hypothetical protein